MSSSPMVAPSVPVKVPEAPAAAVPPRRFNYLGWLGVLGFVALLFVPAYYFKNDVYWLPLFSRYMALALFAMSVDLVWGYTGLLSLGQGLYFGLGVYAIGYCLKLHEAANDMDLPYEVRPDMALPNFMEYCRLPRVPSYIAPLIYTNVAVTVAVVLPLLVAAVFGMIVFRPQLKAWSFFLIAEFSKFTLLTFGIYFVSPFGLEGAAAIAGVIRLIGLPLEWLPITQPIKGVYLSLLIQPILLVLIMLSADTLAPHDGPAMNRLVALSMAVLLPVALTASFHLVDPRQRIRGVYFSLVTQALVLAVFTFVVNQQPYTGGVVGMPNLPALQLFGITFEDIRLYYLITGVLAVCFLGCTLLMQSKVGKVLTAIRDNEYRVLAMGYDTGMYKTFIFALAGAIAGLAGALYVSALRTCGPDSFGISFSIEVVILVAVGGRGTLAGAVIGAVLVNFANTYLSGVQATQRYWPIILGSLFIFVVVFLPDGILGFARKTMTRVTSLFASKTQPAA
jgi:urea ABC transporter permease protein UrtC